MTLLFVVGVLFTSTPAHALDQGRTGRLLTDPGHNKFSRDVWQWLQYTQTDNAQPAFKDAAALVRNHPDFPLQERMIETAEEAMPDSLPDDDIIAWFDAYKPQTGRGMSLYMQALRRQGMNDKGYAFLKEWYPTAKLDNVEQKKILAAYGDFIDREAQVRRMDRLLYTGAITNARAIAMRLGKGYPDLVEARIGLANNAAGVSGLISRVPTSLQNDQGLLYERVRWRRRHDMDFDAVQILHQQPDADKIVNAEEWWDERQIIARRLMATKQYKSAYVLVADHGLKEGSGFAEAEFLAGWLALRRLHDPAKAFKHFEALYLGTNTPISKARGAYWAGRASDEMKNPDIAKQWYQVAAKQQSTFYGQVALGALKAEHRPPADIMPPKTSEGMASFEGQGAVKAARLLADIGLKKELSIFLRHIGKNAKTPEYTRLTAELAMELKRQPDAVKIAREAMQKNIFLPEYGYPTILSRMKSVKLEWALTHAIIRQESAFDTDALSPAGARGLMQLMPATAREVAQKNGLSHSLDMLTSNPNHNIRLGTLYMQQMINRFDGSYALAAAAYNAGPGNVNKWLKAYGDPRKGDIEMLDWIEAIPISETRNYVQRVLEGTYLYRLKLRGVQESFDSPIHVAMK
jgi:soluble lytic murein transglycosylase